MVSAAHCHERPTRSEGRVLQAQMLTATNDRRAYIRRRPVEVAVRDGEPLLTSREYRYVSQVAYARLAVARRHEWPKRRDVRWRWAKPDATHGPKVPPSSPAWSQRNHSVFDADQCADLQSAVLSSWVGLFRGAAPCFFAGPCQSGT